MSQDSNIHRIKELLNRYYLGESTLTEEREIRDYFAKQSIPVELEEDRVCFQSLSHYSDSMVPENIESIVKSAIQDAEKVKRTKKSKALIVSLSTGIAASLLLFLAVGWFVVKVKDKYRNQLVDTYSDPKIALEQTRVILQKISINMNKASDELQYVSLMGESLEKIEPINQLPKQLNQVSKVCVIQDPLSKQSR